MVRPEYITGLRKGILYDIYTKGAILADSRTTPATRAELMAAGLTESDIDYYFELIERLYGDGFICKNGLMTEATPCASEIWTDLCTFCFNCHLIPDPPNRELLPTIYFHSSTEFAEPLEIQRYKECPCAFFLPTVDDYRLFIERKLIGITWCWELADYCNVYLIENADEIIHEYIWDEEQNELVRLTPSRIRLILKNIHDDISNVERAIIEHSHSAPPYIASSDNEWDEMQRLGEIWIRERVRLKWRYQFLLECESWFNVPLPMRHAYR